MLAELQYDVVVMVTEAIETAWIRAARPDAVVLDLTVGLQTEYGVEMARELRADQRFAAIPIVVATANAGALDWVRAVLQNSSSTTLFAPRTTVARAAPSQARDEHGASGALVQPPRQPRSGCSLGALLFPETGVAGAAGP